MEGESKYSKESEEGNLISDNTLVFRNIGESENAGLGYDILLRKSVFKNHNRE